jgi:hypothetical protein
MATMAQLEASTGNGGATNSMPHPSSSSGNKSQPNSTALVQKEMSVSNFAPLNQNWSDVAPPSPIPHNSTTDGGGGGGGGGGSGSNVRRSLLRKSNDYSTSVSASSRMLLSDRKKSKNKTTKYGGLMKKAAAGSNHNGHRGSSMSYQNNNNNTSTGNTATEQIDLDGVLSTMGQDIDFIFRELNALEAEGIDMSPTTSPNAPGGRIGLKANHISSNLGATAKIKNTLGSVARSLARKEEYKSLKSGWPSSLEPPATPVPPSKGSSMAKKKDDPLLIDEDGFIISPDPGADSFGDPFSTSNKSPTAQDFDSAFDKDASPFFSPISPTGSTSRRKASGRSTSGSSGRSPKGVLPPPPSDVPRRTNADTRNMSSSKGRSTSRNREERIDEVEVATKKKIDMLRKLAAERMPDDHLVNKLDFVEAETMKQIARLRNRLGESRRGLVK